MRPRIAWPRRARPTTAGGLDRIIRIAQRWLVVTRRWPAALLALVLLGIAMPRANAGAALPPGTRLESFTVGTTTYLNVEIRSINARTVMFTHAGGMASVKLRDLPPEWQQQFGYDPAAEAAADKAITAPTPKPASKPAARAPRRAERSASRVEPLLRQFGTPAVVNAEVDLRPKYFAMELIVKNQGRRPSCAIFAVVSALEFQLAELTGQPQKLSEEYLSWATRKVVHRVVHYLQTDEAGNITIQEGDVDLGFTLGEVVSALRAYGIPLQASMPNRFGRALAEIEDPPPQIVEEARTHQRVYILPIPGRDAATAVNNIVHALNAGIPVPIGMAWPHYRTIRNGSLSGQNPMEGGGHAVTLVGYRAPDQQLQNAVFFFKNSWGPSWGQGGYGTVTYGYLEKYLGSAVLLEVQRG